jgi:hypothetical protein
VAAALGDDAARAQITSKMIGLIFGPPGSGKGKNMRKNLAAISRGHCTTTLDLEDA